MNRSMWILLVAAVACAGCSSSSDYAQKAPVSPAPVAVQTDFSNFVVSQYEEKTSAETATPIDVEATNFAFADEDNPVVFNALIAAAP